MRKAAALLLVVGTISFPFPFKSTTSAAQLVAPVHVENEPGILESLLLSTPTASVKRRELGTLPAPEDVAVKFFAIVTDDPISKKTVKGLKVELKSADQADVVYLDEDGLKQLQESLESALKGQRFIRQHWDRYSPSELEKPQLDFAVNRSPATGELYAALVVGFYCHERRFGIYLHAPWGKRHHGIQLYLPDASTRQVVDLVAAGRAFLQANSAPFVEN